MITITINEKELLQNPNDDSLGEYVRRKFEHETYVNKNSYDKCLICGEETPYINSKNINERVGYIEGGGQGCYKPNICDKI
jgi:hypothetical protein